MVNNRQFILSDDLFSGFTKTIDLDETNTLSELIDEVYNELYNLFKEQKLDLLLANLKTKKFHIHDYSFEDILLSQPMTVFYICSHC